MVKEYTKTLDKLDDAINEIVADESTSSERKMDLMRLVCKEYSNSWSEVRMIERILEGDYEAKTGGKCLTVINNRNSQDFFSTEEPYLVDQIIPSGDLTIVGGLSGASKSTFVASICAAILRGDDTFLGQDIKHNLCDGIYYFGLDGGQRVYGPILKRAGLLGEDGLIDGFNFISSEERWGLNTKNLEKLEAQIKDKPNQLVIVDSLLAATQAVSVSENSAKVAARIMDLKRSCEKHGATLIILAHMKKDATQDTIGPDSLRGHSSIPAFAGSIVTLNFLDQTDKGKTTPDRKSSLRRLFWGHRTEPTDLLIDIDFESGEINRVGDKDFYEELGKLRADDPESASENVLNEIRGQERGVFDCLLNHATEGGKGLTQTEIYEYTRFSKSNISKKISSLKGHMLDGIPLIQEDKKKKISINPELLGYLNGLVKTDAPEMLDQPNGFTETQLSQLAA